MRNFKFQQTGSPCNLMVLPTDGINVSVCKQRDKIVIDGYGIQRPIDITVVNTPNLNMFEAVTGDINHLRNVFTAGTITLLSDGSVKTAKERRLGLEPPKQRAYSTALRVHCEQLALLLIRTLTGQNASGFWGGW
jgi:hypothetical protein